MLIEGLQDPAKAMLPPEKALQLLSYDVHAGAFDVARRIADKPPNELARREAMRVLAADGGSADMFEKVLRNKSEPEESASSRRPPCTSWHHSACSTPHATSCSTKARPKACAR
jgi:hypothetical protein